MSLFLSSSIFASNCPIAVEHELYECKGNFRAKTQLALDTYKSNIALTSEGFAKNLVIDFDVVGEELIVSSPCKISLRKNKKINVTGNICLNSKKNIIINPYSDISALNIEMTTTDKITIRHHAKVSTKDLTLISTGTGENSRVHIRHDSTINATNLTLSSEARSTLGHTSTYTILENINVSSRSGFSAIWKNSNITAKNIEFNSQNRVRLSKGVNITGDVVNISAPDCTSPKAIVTSASQNGNCHVVGRPVARLSVSTKVAVTGQEITFNASKSKDDKAITNYKWTFSDGETSSGLDSIIKKSFDEEGVYKATLVVSDEDGWKSSRTRKITVTGAPTTPKDADIFFHYISDQSSTNLVYMHIAS